MDNLWILTEERPKPSVILQIVELYKRDFNTNFIESNITIRPIIENEKFKFTYIVEGLEINDISKIFIKTVSGSSSFLDFLVFKQKDEPTESGKDNLLMAIEETKTSDDESRNTGVYQRGSKFVYIEPYYKNVKLYMLYNEELEAREEKKPSDTSIFGTNILLTLGVSITGKDTSKWFKPFNSLDELIQFKEGMRKPPASNVPINITRYHDRIEISGRLAKPAEAGNIGHDPNIGALSMISKCIRCLGWNKDIVITHHGVSQNYVTKTHGKNKFLYICKILNVKLDGIDMPCSYSLPEMYWHYEKNSEKVASILMHITAEYHGMRGIYQNHAGCERGYFKTKKDKLITLPKKDRNGVNLYIPDLVLHDNVSKTIILIEGKKISTLAAGVAEIEDYDSIEFEYIKPHYPDCNIVRGVSIFGGNSINIPHKKVLFYLSSDGRILINPNAPDCLKNAFRLEGINC